MEILQKIVLLTFLVIMYRFVTKDLSLLLSSFMNLESFLKYQKLNQFYLILQLQLFLKIKILIIQSYLLILSLQFLEH